jgi:hypothetical protein
VTSNGVTGVWDANFMGVWHLNEATNTTRLDSTSNNNNLADATNTAAATGQVGDAADFVPTDYLTLSDAAQTGLDLGAQFTLQAWVKGDEVTSNKVILSREVIPNSSYKLRFSSDRFTFMTSFDGTAANNLNQSGTSVAGTWYHVVGVYNSPNMYLYLNGALNNSLATAGGAVFNGTAPFNISSQNNGTQPFDGIIDEARVSNVARSVDWILTEFNNQSNCAGFFTVGAEEQLAAPGDFNAFETSTGTAAVGVIKTKIAGATISIDIIALNTNRKTINTAFTGTVTVDVLNASNNGGTLDGNGCRSIPSTWTVIQTFSAAFVAGDLGRKTVSFTQANSYPDVRLRITYATGPKIGCSNDNFAIRPNTLTSFSVTDGTETTAGTTRTLDLLTFAATTPIHKAGRPFTVRATAVNTASATTTNYTGTPTPTLTACVGAACTATFGTVTLGASFASGVLTSNAATYNNVGSFAVQLVDSTFANVDASDGSTTTERNITSGTPINVGRFVPDHFAVSYNTPVLGTACGSFTYIGQVFNYTTVPVITVTAQDFANNTTTLYADPVKWWRITDAILTSSGSKSYTAAVGTLNTSGITGTDPVIVDSGGGIGTLTFSSGTGLLFTRSTPVAPFDADISLAINVIDADGVVMTVPTTNPARFGTATPGTGIAFSGGKPMRFGQLALGNALGSELLNLPIPIKTQYWNGTAFVTNTSDNCTSIVPANIKLTYPTGSSLNATNMDSSHISGGSISSGAGNLTLTKPSPAPTTSGSVDLCVDLGGDATCVATPAGMSYLQGVWSGTTYTLDPRARAAFGFSKGSYSGGGRDPFVYQQENY